MMSMLRGNLIFCDPVGYRYTTNKQEGYLSFTEIFEAKHPGYGCGINQECVSVGATKSVNFDNLMNILKSEDPALLEKNRWQFDGEYRFLDGGKNVPN